MSISLEANLIFNKSKTQSIDFQSEGSSENMTQRPCSFLVRQYSESEIFLVNLWYPSNVVWAESESKAVRPRGNKWSVVMFHNLNPGHFFSSCTHTGVHMASDWSRLSKPWPVIGPWVAWQMSHTSHDTMAAWHTTLPVPPPPSSTNHPGPGQGVPPPLLTNMNIIALSQLIVFRPLLPGWESVRNIHRSNLVKICNHHR